MDYNNALSAPMQTSAISAAAPKAPAKKSKDAGDNRGELRHISVDPTENGFEVVCSYEPKKVNPKMDRWAQMPEDVQMSFESTPSAVAYVTKMMNQASGAEGSPADTDSDEANY